MIELLKEHGMYVCVVIGLLAGIPAVWLHRDKLSLRPPGILLLCILYSVCSVISAMLFAQMEFLISTGKTTGLGAVSTYGIYFIGSLMVLAVCKLLHLKTSGVMDLYALYAMPSFFMLRLNCLDAGCCFGLPMFDTGLKWPTRESELVFYVVMFVIFWRMLRKDKVPGQLFPVLMASYGCFRFVNQWFRDTGSEGFHMSHGWSILCAVIGFTLLFEMRAHRTEKKPKTKKKRK